MVKESALDPTDLLRCLSALNGISRRFRSVGGSPFRTLVKDATSGCSSLVVCRGAKWDCYASSVDVEDGIIECLEDHAIIVPADLCAICEQVLREGYAAECRAIWKALPRYFGLPDWDFYSTLE